MENGGIELCYVKALSLLRFISELVKISTSSFYFFHFHFHVLWTIQSFIHFSSSLCVFALGDNTFSSLVIKIRLIGQLFGYIMSLDGLNSQLVDPQLQNFIEVNWNCWCEKYILSVKTKKTSFFYRLNHRSRDLMWVWFNVKECFYVMLFAI